MSATRNARYLEDLVDVNVVSPPSTGQVLVWDTTAWAPSSVAGGVIATGVAVIGAQAGAVLYTDASTTLAVDASNFRYDPIDRTFNVGQVSIAADTGIINGKITGGSF